MPFTHVMQFLGDKKGSIFLAGIFVAAASFFIVVLTAPRYQVSTDFQIVQVNTTSQDYYTLFKSSEYLGKMLGEAMQSERFINAALETGKMSKEFLPTDKADRLKAWRKMVVAKSDAELGKLTVTVKADTDREAGKVMQAVSDVLIARNAEFRGGDEKSVEIRVLSGPITERSPTMKELALIIVAGFLAGATLMAMRVVVRGAVRGY